MSPLQAPKRGPYRQRSPFPEPSMDGMWYWIRRTQRSDLTACDFIMWGYSGSHCVLPMLTNTPQQESTVTEAVASETTGAGKGRPRNRIITACHTTYKTPIDWHFLRFSTHVHTIINNKSVYLLWIAQNNHELKIYVQLQEMLHVFSLSLVAPVSIRIIQQQVLSVQHYITNIAWSLKNSL